MFDVDRKPSFQAIEMSGRASFDRLQLIHGRFNPPYGSDVSEYVWDFLIRKLSVAVDERVVWLKDELELRTAKRGMIEYDGAPRLVASGVLVGARNFGPEDFLPIIEAVVADMEHTNFDIPEALRADIASVRQWLSLRQSN